MLWLLPKVWLLRVVQFATQAFCNSVFTIKYQVNCLLNIYNLCILQSVMNHDDTLKNCHLSRINKCLVLLLTCPKMLSAAPNFLGRTKNWIAFSTAPKDFVSAQKLNGNRLLVWYRDRLSLVWYKKFGTYTICFGICRRPWQKSLI